MCRRLSASTFMFGLSLALTVPGSLAVADGDPAAGETLFRKCKACHVIDKEKNRLGPHLAGLLGRKAGTVEGFKYSEAMKSAGIVWDEETLDAHLADPKGYLPKNKMAFVGLKKDHERMDLIAYLKHVSQN